MSTEANAAPYSRLAGVYDELVVDPCFAQWAGFLDQMWADDHIDRVLDVCCGTGLMTIELMKRASCVVGLDASPAMLARAAAQLPSGALDTGAVVLVEAVLPDLPVEGIFDAAVSTFDGLNYLAPGDFSLSLHALARHIRPRGWLVFDVHGEATAAFLRAHPVLEGQDGDAAFRLTSTVSDDGAMCTTTIDLLHPDESQCFSETHPQYLHSTPDIAAALDDAGFELIKVVNEYTDVPADDQTLRATWIARRKGD